MGVTIHTNRPTWRAPACVLEGGDADTRKVLIATSEESMRIAGLRIFGVDAPESKPQYSTATDDRLRQQEVAVGRLVNRVVESWIAERSGSPLLEVRHPGGVITFDFLLDYVGGDKYGGRVLGDLRAPDVASGEESLRDFLLQDGLARPYEGKSKRPWTGEELDRIGEYASAYLAGERRIATQRDEPAGQE